MWGEGEAMVVGIAGRVGSGKSALGRFLAVQYDGVVLPIASTLKGLGLWGYGPLVFRPQWDSGARAWLQSYGDVVRGALGADVLVELSSGLWNGFVVVPDVRLKEEVEWVRRGGGVVIFIGSGERGEHATEGLGPEECDEYIPYTWHEWEELCSEAVRVLGRPRPRKPRIYLSSNITGSVDYEERYQEMAAIVEGAGMEALVPMDVVRGQVGDVLDVVKEDLRLLGKADGMWVHLDGPSLGVGFELGIAMLLDLPIVVSLEGGGLEGHPFLEVLGVRVGKEEAAGYLLWRLMGYGWGAEG